MSTVYKTEPGKAYFITFTVVGWADVFIRPEYVEVLQESLAYCQQHKGLEVFAYCIMSSHIHMLAAAGAGNLSAAMRDFKAHTARSLLALIESNTQESRREWLMQLFADAGQASSNNVHHQFWQDGFHPIEVYSRKMIDQKVQYILNNPVKAGLVTTPEHYLLCSAHPQQRVRLQPL